MQNKKVIKSNGSAVSSVAFMNSLAALNKPKKRKSEKKNNSQNEYAPGIGSENALRPRNSTVVLGEHGLGVQSPSDELQQKGKL